MSGIEHSERGSATFIVGKRLDDAAQLPILPCLHPAFTSTGPSELEWPSKPCDCCGTDNDIFKGGMMPVYLTTALLYASAAAAEIAGCFAFWAWLRLGRSMWWIAPGIAALAGFAYILTLAPSQNAGRAYAAYGGIYIIASLLWLWVVEGQVPDRWDTVGAGLALVAAAIILFAPRQG